MINNKIAGSRNVAFFERISFRALLIFLQIEGFNLVGINPVKKLILSQEPLFLLLDEGLSLL